MIRSPATAIRVSLALLAVVAVTATATVAQDHQNHEGMDHSKHQMMPQGDYQKSFEHYTIADVTLTDQDGREIVLRDLLQGERPIALTFIFTTCTTICPVMTATFSGMTKELGADLGDLQLVTISIDPEYDRPDVLKQYATRWKAGPEWEFLTGDLDEVVEALKSLDAYFGDKVNHEPLYLFRMPADHGWTRIEGLASAKILAAEYRQLRGL